MPMDRPWHEMTALALGAGIGAGRIDALELTQHFLERIREQDPDHRIYLTRTEERALGEAAAARARARAGARRSPLDGVPISWKDCYDVAGVVTTGGSPLLLENIPERDAALVRRATNRGLVCLGKTNLPDFAFSGLGINPHFGTPANPFDADVARIPGGSSAGAAVSLARGLAGAAMGSDTGGSVRIPAAWNGLVGLKTTFGLLATQGMTPLGPSLDSAGPLTRDVADANALLALLADRAPADLEGAGLAGRRLAVAQGVVWQDLEPGVAQALEAGLERLSRAGAEIVEEGVVEFDEATEVLARRGSYLSAEAYALWGELVESAPDKVFRPIAERMRLGLEMSAAQSEGVRIALTRIGERLHERMAGFDAFLCPTVPISPPPIAELEPGGEAYLAANNLALRNTRLGNFLYCSALTLPCGEDGRGLPVGLMLMAPPFAENRLLRLGQAIETALLD
jgi:aspartyl-tRNA(Asn)/glutamyl-tRNA(Gln) amidotransferase subunit A